MCGKRSRDVEHARTAEGREPVQLYSVRGARRYDCTRMTVRGSETYPTLTFLVVIAATRMGFDTRVATTRTTRPRNIPGGGPRLPCLRRVPVSLEVLSD